MKKPHFRILVGACLCLLSTLACSVNTPNSHIAINGPWAVSFGDSIKMYGEVIYQNNRLCDYSDEFGLVYRDLKIKSDSILEIYDGNVLDNIRTFAFLDSLNMLQTIIYDSLSNNRPLLYQRIVLDNISVQKLFQGDTIEQRKYIEGFNSRKLLWEMMR